MAGLTRIHKALLFLRTFVTLSVVLLTASPAWATRFIKDVMVVGGSKDNLLNVVATINNYRTHDGWTFIDQDLNAGAGGDYEAAAAATAANGRDTVWQCYAAGLDPEDPGAPSFSAVLSFTDGAPVVAWDPAPSGGAGQPRRTYAVEARKTLSGDEDWTDVTANPSLWLEDGWRFFRVTLRIQE